MRFCSAQAAHPDGSIAVEECLLLLAQQARDGRHLRRPNLGFVYLTDALQPQAERILMLLKTRTGIPDWVGAVGAAICGGNAAYTDEPALAVMLGQFAPGSFNVFSGSQRPPARTARTDGGAVAAQCALVHVDPRNPDLPDLVHDMAAKVAGGLFGGVTSGRRTAQIADRVLEGGLSGVVFAADVALATGVTQAVHPLRGGRLHRVTAAADGVLDALDGRPAFDVLLEDAGLRGEAPAAVEEGAAAATRSAQRRRRLEALGRRGLFVGIETAPSAGAAAAGDDEWSAAYLARPVLALDPLRRRVTLGTPVTAGQRLLFCTRDEAAARADLQRVCAGLRAQLAAQGRPARGALYVSCASRGSQLFGEPLEELRLIREQLGDVPLAGFSAAGEIAGRDLHLFSGVLTLFC